MKNIKLHIAVIGLLGIYLTTSAQSDWNVNPTQFQNSMTIISMLNIEGEISSNINDRIGVFFGNECRGVANVLPQQGQYYAMITVWSNKSDNEVLDVKIASGGTTYDLKQKINFVKDEVLGTFGEPYIFYTNLAEKEIKAYNFFTPNGDGKNEYFMVDDRDIVAVRDLTFKVYTLDGMEVYQQKDYDNTWRGTAKNDKDLPQGAYYYLFVDADGKVIYKGSVTIVR